MLITEVPGLINCASPPALWQVNELSERPHNPDALET